MFESILGNGNKESKKNNKSEQPNEYKIIVDYLMRKMHGCKTQADIDRKVEDIKQRMAADEKKRLEAEEQERRVAEGIAKRAEADMAMAQKHLGHIKAIFRGTGMKNGGNVSIVDIGPDLKITCPECGKEADVSKAVIQMAYRYEEKGALIAEALAGNVQDMRYSTLVEPSGVKVNHYSVINGVYCTTVIEVFIEGCRSANNPKVRIV